jgi:hypothetical protein
VPPDPAPACSSERLIAQRQIALVRLTEPSPATPPGLIPSVTEQDGQSHLICAADWS